MRRVRGDQGRFPRTGIKHRRPPNRPFKIVRKQMRAITIIKRSERRPVSVQSETLVKQPELASVSNDRALIKTVESWVIERRESASNSHRQAVIRLSKNGPYIVEGPVEIFDTEGSKITVNKPKIALCRGGASSNKPLFYGTDSQIAFHAAAAINPESAE